MSRPTKMTDELLDKASRYIYVSEQGEPFGVCAGYITDGSVIPTIEGFASYIGVSRETVNTWITPPDRQMTPDDELYDYETLLVKHQEFSDIVDVVKSEQARMLINGGLDSKYNASIAKLILSGKHGYVERSETDVTTNGNDVTQAIDANLLTQFLMSAQDNTKR